MKRDGPGGRPLQDRETDRTERAGYSDEAAEEHTGLLTSYIQSLQLTEIYTFKETLKWLKLKLDRDPVEDSTWARHSRRPGNHSHHLWVWLGQRYHTRRGQRSRVVIPGERKLALRCSDQHLSSGAPKKMAVYSVLQRSQPAPTATGGNSSWGSPHFDSE